MPVDSRARCSCVRPCILRTTTTIMVDFMRSRIDRTNDTENNKNAISETQGVPRMFVAAERVLR